MCAAASGLQSDLFFLRPINNTDDFVMTDLWTFLQNFNDKMTMMGDSVHRYQVGGVDIYTYLHISTPGHDWQAVRAAERRHEGEGEVQEGPGARQGDPQHQDGDSDVSNDNAV